MRQRSAEGSVRIGIIGAGRIADIMAAAYADLPAVQLLAVADINRTTAQRFSDKYDIKHQFQDYNELLALADLDAVLICLPTFLHREASIAACRARKHIFCQKPLGLTVDDCEAIGAAVAEAQVILQVGFMIRFTPPFREVKELLLSGEIGELIALRSSVFGWEPSDEWFYDPAKGGGVLIDTIIHTFDLFRWYGGEVTTLFASGGAYVLAGAKKYGTPDNIMCSLRFESGAMGDIYGSWTSGYGDKTLEVYGSNGSVLVDLVGKQGGHVFVKRGSAAEGRVSGWRNLGLLWKFGYQREARHFVDTIGGRCRAEATIADAIAAQRLAVLADECIRTGELAHISKNSGRGND
jgi:myo-inositol 2-dehydrogenase/D-chiro-inositol 1-dehydrogenase